MFQEREVAVRVPVRGEWKVKRVERVDFTGEEVGEGGREGGGQRNRGTEELRSLTDGEVKKQGTSSNDPEEKEERVVVKGEVGRGEGGGG